MKYEAIIAMQNGDIVHYGVLGMKWGQRKLSDDFSNYSNKKLMRTMNKAQSKADKYAFDKSYYKQGGKRSNKASSISEKMYKVTGKAKNEAKKRGLKYESNDTIKNHMTPSDAAKTIGGTAAGLGMLALGSPVGFTNRSYHKYKTKKYKIKND